MKTVAAYYQESPQLSTKKVLKEIKERAKHENWTYYDVYIDKTNEYEALMFLITNKFPEIDILYIYNLNAINDDFYWDILMQSVRVDNILLIE